MVDRDSGFGESCVSKISNITIEMDLHKAFSKIKVLVVGDVMIDKYLIGDVKRISPEAPVPIVNLTETKITPGGAANVAANISALGGTTYLVGIVGDDQEGTVLPSLLEKNSLSSEHLVKIPNHPTTLKIRIMAQKQQIARIDQEKHVCLNDAEILEVWKIIEKVIDKVDVIVVSDYNKGFLTENLLERLISMASDKDKLIIVDPKGNNYRKYEGADVLTPNVQELCQFMNIERSNSDIKNGALKLMEELDLKALLLTRGEQGMTIFEKNREARHLPAEARHVYDVTGAGDTVIAVLALCLGSKYNFVEAANIANKAAGLAVQEPGTTVVDIKKLQAIINI